MIRSRRRAVQALLGAPLLLSSLGAGPPDSPGEAAAPTEPIVFARIAGDDLSAMTLVPAIAARVLASHGASPITLVPARPPWTSEISGRLLDGRRLVVLVRAHSTGDGFSMLARGLADMVCAARRPTPAEREQLRHLGDFGSTGASYAMGATGLTMALHRSNHVPSISSGELSAIYSGRVTDWSQIGAPAGPIHPYGRSPGAASADLFTDLFMGREPYGRNFRHVGTFRELGDVLFSDPAALAYMPVTATAGLHTVRLRVGNSLCALPDNYGLKSGDYPLEMTLRLYRSPQSQSDAVGDFFREAASAQSNVDAVATGFVRLEPSLLVAEPADGAPAPYRGLVHSALRISTTIRFDPGPVTVDEVGTRAINQLAAYLRFLGIPKGKLRHMAFCDSVGDAQQNMEVARQLGRIVALELKERRVTPGEVVSFGATYPLASDRLPAGRRINRRVETWILP